ncbi:MAG: hypothetical protein QNJ91_16715 [Gammaproteobacteria bacterium]|nr:hypothetical protein [Gammaproteobacteria bacterium]
MHTFGKLESTFRATRPSEGADSDSFINTVEFGGTSYIWQPWFGTWSAVGAFTRSDTDSDTDSSAELFTGDVQVNLFHRSNFPLTAFASLRDSRLEIDNLSNTTSDLRTLRLGISQQYRDIANSAYYRGSYERDVQDDLTNDETVVNQRLLFDAQKTGRRHRVNAVGSLNNTTNTFGNSEFTTTQGNLSHVYTPNARLTVSNNANATLLDGDSDAADVTAALLQATSLTDWRPSEEWRLRGEVRVAQDRTETELGGTSTTQRFEARALARYEITEQASVTAELDYDRELSDESSTTRTLQRLSAVYNSDPIPWREFSYAWNANAGVDHETDSSDDNVFGQDLGLGHSITRVYTPMLRGAPLPIVFSAAQDGRVRNESDDGAEFEITHRATANASYASEGGVTTGYLSAFDTRRFGRNDVGTVSVIAGLTHSRAFTRFRSFDVTSNYSFTTTRSDDATSENDVLTVELNYRDARLFGVSRLTFDSRLRGTDRDLLATSTSGTGRQIEWENEVEYQIGLLEINSRLTLTANEQRDTWVFFLSAIRRF